MKKQTSVVGVVARNSPEFLETIFETWSGGDAVAVLQAPDDRVRIDATGASRILKPSTGHGWLNCRMPSFADDRVAQIMFTSGTEGEPKGVVLTHQNLADVVSRLSSAMELDSEIREYVGVPVYHSFGFGRCRAVASVGGRAYIPERGFNPVELNEMLIRGKVNAFSAVPSLLRILLQSGAITAEAAEHVRWLEIGSQYMSRYEKEQVSSLFPQAVIVQHYGLTEASRTTFLNLRATSPGLLDTVGRTNGQVEIRIDPDERIQIRGPHVASHLLQGGQRVALGDSEGWLTTNDRGRLRDGHLEYLGRVDDMINCGGLKLPPEALEASVRGALGAAFDLAITRIPDPELGEGILIAVAGAAIPPERELIDATASAASVFGVNARGAIRVTRIAALPRTSTGKILRRAITDEYAAIPVSMRLRPSQQPRATRTLRTELMAILSVTSASDDDTFVSLGGDSLRFIQASVRVQKFLGYLPPRWEYQPLAALDALTPESKALAVLEPSVVLRAIAIFAIVVNHSGALLKWFAIDGAAFLLLLPSGYSFARFQLQRVLESGKSFVALSGLQRILIPTLALTVLFQLRARTFEPSTLLLYDNFLRQATTPSFWFIEVLLQIHLILALLLSFNWVRTNFKQQPYWASLVCVLAGAALRLGMPYLWNTDQLFNLVPHMVLWHFFLGWCVLFAQKPWQRWLNGLLIACLAATQWPYPSRMLWILCGGAFINWSPPVRAPFWLTRAVTVVGASSLYIYLIHGSIFHPFAVLFPWAGYVGQVSAAVAAGICFWWGTEQIWSWSFRLLAQRRRSGA